MAITTSGTKHGSIPHDFIFHPPMIFKSPPNFTSSKRTKSSLSSTVVPKSRVRTKFRPSKAPHYYYTALPNNSFVSEPDDPPGRSSPPPTTTSSPWHRSTPAFSLTLENSGSVARDHLASERTFLAYTRTSLALTSAGVGLVQLFTVATASSHLQFGHRLHVYIQPLGASVIVLGLVVLVIGFLRYFAVQAALTKGYFPVARSATTLMTLALATLTCLTFGVLLAGKLGPSANP